MNDQNPYAAPQAALHHAGESLVLTGELPDFVDLFAFQRGAERAGSALGHAIALVFVMIFLGFFIAIGGGVLISILVGLFFLVASQNICWRYFTGLSRMADASRYRLQLWLNRAKFFFVLGWICVVLKFVVFFSIAGGRAVVVCCEVVDNAAGAAMALSLGIAALQLGQELSLSALRRVAWMTMFFLGGSHFVIGFSDAVMGTEFLLQRPSLLIRWSNDTELLLAWSAGIGFLIGYFSLMGLFSQLGRLPIRHDEHKETILDQATIEQRRRMTEGQ